MTIGSLPSSSAVSPQRTQLESPITGNNYHAQRAAYRETVARTVIHSIFDARHYEALWTCAMAKLLLYASDYVCLILYITLHTTNLKPSCQMYFIALSPVRSEVHS